MHRSIASVVALVVLLAGCATATFKWVGRSFLPNGTTLVNLESTLDDMQSLPTYEALRDQSLTRDFDARQGTPTTITYTWVDTYEGSVRAGIGVIDGAIGTLTTEAFAATFMKDTGTLINYQTYYIPGLTHKEIELSTTPVVGAAFAVWLATKISGAISDAGDNISGEINEVDENVSREVDEIDDEAEERIKRRVEEAADKIKREVRDTLDDIRKRNPF